MIASFISSAAPVAEEAKVEFRDAIVAAQTYSPYAVPPSEHGEIKSSPRR